jgi:hypothetical protein
MMSNTDYTKKNRGEPRCSRRASRSCLLLDTRHVTHIVKTCWILLYTNKINTPLALLQTNESKGEPRFMLFCNLNSIISLFDFIIINLCAILTSCHLRKPFFSFLRRQLNILINSSTCLTVCSIFNSSRFGRLVVIDRCEMRQLDAILQEISLTKAKKNQLISISVFRYTHML